MQNLLWQSSPALRLVASRNQAARPLPSNRATFSPHHHSFFELGIVVAGNCTWKLQRRHSLRAGQAILVKPGTVHFEEPSPENETKLAWLGFDYQGVPPKWSEQIISLGDDMPEIAQLFRAIDREHSDPGEITRRRVALALQSVLVLVSRCAECGTTPGGSVRAPRRPGLNPRQTRSMESSAHYFRHNFRESLSIAQVAAYYSFCPAYFSTLFRRRFRVSPRTFVQQAKIDRAAELLSASDLTLKEIGNQCGFVDAAHLAKAFKRRHRITPGAFRKKNRV